MSKQEDQCAPSANIEVIASSDETQSDHILTTIHDEIMTDFEIEMAGFLKELDWGHVITFGDLAAAGGRPRAARMAGRFLSQHGENLPWWRVVYSCGHLPPNNPDLQTTKLQEENVTVSNGRVINAPSGRFAKPPQPHSHS